MYYVSCRQRRLSRGQRRSLNHLAISIAALRPDHRPRILGAVRGGRHPEVFLRMLKAVRAIMSDAQRAMQSASVYDVTCASPLAREAMRRLDVASRVIDADYGSIGGSQVEWLWPH